MDIYEFFIRFSMINGKKLSNLLSLPAICHNLDANSILKRMQLSPEQQHAFFHVDCKRLAHALAWLDHDQHTLLTLWHADYPYLLKQISQPPLLLFCKGNLALLDTPQVAMVGSRYFSPYGAHWARQFATQLSQAGMTITSGLAMGIDAISHRSALAVNGATIAVLGSGLDHLTPKINHALAQAIIEHNGLIISEFLPDVTAHPKHFPRRNRLISGLSLATLIIEASLKSGSLITARYALEQNRELFTIAGDMSCDNYAGNHWLIQQGANLVTHPQQLLDHLQQMPQWLTLPNQTKPSATDKHSALPAPQQQLLAQLSCKPLSADQLAAQSQLSITEINQLLLDLELAGLVQTLHGGYIRAD